MLGSKVGGLVSDRMNYRFGRGGRLLPTLYGITFYVLSCIQFGLATSLWVIIFSTSLAGFFFGLQRPGVYAFVIELFPKHSSGVSASLLFVQFSFGFASLMVGPLYWTTDEGKLFYFIGTGSLAFLFAIPVFIILVKNWNV